MSLDAPFGEMEHRPHFQIALADSKRTFHHPQPGILLYDILATQVSIGYVAFQAIPFCVLVNFLLADSNLYALAYLKDFVVAPFVDLITARWFYNIPTAVL